MNNMEKLTIIIPFLNEGIEVQRTVASIKKTVVGEYQVYLINDNSDDGYDYEAIANQYKCIYIHNEQRLGVAASRNKGVGLCDTKYFLLLDAHMRFYKRGWNKDLLIDLKNNPRSIICSQTKVLESDSEGVVSDTEMKSFYCGGYIDFGSKSIFRTEWTHVDLAPYNRLIEIPCIIGAAYACSKEYWNYIKGLEGLITYGTDEELLSVKVWLEGGRCLLSRDWTVGHIYRKEFPYEVPSVDIVYNRLFVIELFFPYAVKRDLYSKMKAMYKDNFSKAYTMLRENYKSIKVQKEYLDSIFTRDIDYFLNLNSSVINYDK